MWLALFAVAALYAAVELQWLRRIAPDEVEFFRATRWIAEGRLPFRDYWEHHTPLQWFVFAPVASLADGPGAGSILLMRWAQVIVTAAMLAMLLALLRRAELERWQRWLALLLLLASPSFVGLLIEYRIEIVGNCAFVGGLLLAARRQWFAYGVVMSLSVLANLRLAPLVCAISAVLLFTRLDERRWRFDARALRMFIGVLVTAAAFLAHLALTNSTRQFFDALRYNTLADAAVRGTGIGLRIFLVPLVELDLAAIGITVAGAAGVAVALREIARPSTRQILALAAIFSVIVVAIPAVQYAYFLQTPYLLLAPLAATLVAARHEKWAAIGVAVALAAAFGRIPPAARADFELQNAMMVEADRRTTPAESVWSGSGLALRRRPPHRYWFLPSGVRFLAAQGKIDGYDAHDMRADPPGAILVERRVVYWLRQFPGLAAYVTRHYVPLYRDLWLPGLSGTVDARGGMRWIVPKSGRYRVYASELLVKHPWFRDPLRYAEESGAGATTLEIPLARLPLVDPRLLRMTVDGKPVAATEVVLQRGSVVTLQSASPRTAGVLIVPHDFASVAFTPEEAPL